MENKNYSNSEETDPFNRPIFLVQNDNMSYHEMEYLINKGEVDLSNDYKEIITPQKSPFESAYQNEVKRKIDEVLSTLNPKEADVIKYRYKIKDLTCRSSKRNTDEPTFKDIGYELKVTGCRVRQIYEKAMRKLRKGSRARILEELWR